jgi:outer membrane protein OmpA-like peptidoglycan-associated protein
MKIKWLAPLFVALTLVFTACSDDKKGSDLYGGTDGGNLPGDKVDMDNAGSGIGENDRPAGINPDTDVNYQTLASSTVYFEFDKSTIGADQRGKLETVRQWLESNPGRSLFLAGHADKRGTPEYNRALGERRALAVREYLAGLGISPGTLYTNSYGSDRPAVEGDTEDAFAKNRRVEIGVINQK